MLGSTVTIARALADPLRLRLLAVLRRRQLCASQLVVFAGEPPSTVSGHLAILRAAGLVSARREGRWLWYRLAENPSREAAAALQWVFRALRGDPQVRRDRQRIRHVQRRHPQQTARVYLRSSF
ncbi:MAG: metalloregulator ArsR/SmtB family transcription factor [bacterium]|nr:metalloregulator ArsR/SmtB family transcription factor [bacterium]